MTRWIWLAGVAAGAEPCRIEIVDGENGWPVPLVELKTTDEQRFVSDNAGLIAIDDPSLLDRELWFHVKGHGYGVKKDGFGYGGVRLTPAAGKTLQVKVERQILAKRLGRLTGGGLFAERQKLGGESPPESGVFGCDSVLLARHRDSLFWLWGDTTLPRYPLGVFHSTAAVTGLRPLEDFKPPLSVRFRIFRDDKEVPRGVATMPGEGPTWLTGMISLPDRSGKPRLAATYTKIRNHLDEYEIGLCVWDDASASFQRHKILWREGDGEKPPVPRGHPLFWDENEGQREVLFGDPFPVLRCPANFEAWENPSAWKSVTVASLPEAADGSGVKPHRGSVAWNPHRRRWVSIFTQTFGKPSAFGEIWYAEADSPLGPWGTAVKVLTHDNYTFYNPRIHPELVPEEAGFLVFEGTYTAEFADRPQPTPRYNYNQVLYRLDLDDAGLKPAQGR